MVIFENMKIYSLEVVFAIYLESCEVCDNSGYLAISDYFGLLLVRGFLVVAIYA